ncbi:MAG: MFS transporter [Actinobacteria bacterium]|nr:MFS transporter [Actinomycetota bacterium]
MSLPLGISPRLASRPLPTALLLSGGFIVAADARVAAPLLPAIADDFHVSIGAAGLTVAFYALAYALGQVFYGPLGDRVGKVQVIRVMLMIFALASMLCAAAPSYPALLGLRLATGIAAAAVIPMSLAYLGDTVAGYAARQKAIGIFLSAIVSGQVLGQAIGGILAGVFSWRAIFVLIGVVGLGLAAAIWAFAAPPARRQAERGQRSFREIFAADRPLFLVATAETFVFLGTFPFAASSLVEEHGASYPLVGALSALFAVGSVGASRLLPKVARNTGDAVRFSCGATVMAAGFGLLALTPGAVLFGLAVLVFGVGFTLAHSTLQARTTEVSPATRGTAVSLFAGLANVGAALGTFAAGALIDGFGFGPTFAAATVALLLLATVAPNALRGRRRIVRPAAVPDG